MRRRCVLSALGAAILVIGIAAHALANSDGYSFKYYGEWMTSWSGCACVPAAQGLSYPDDQINGFAAVMDANHHQRVAVYGNHDVWAADLVEDGLGGADNVEADGADIYAFAGHGTVTNDPNGQTYKSPRCSAGYNYDDCWLDSAAVRTNETTGAWATNRGSARWLVLLTCNSVDTDPYNQWIETFNQSGTEYIVGYRGLSADSFTTDEVAADYATNSFVNSTTFKAGWFSATSDWWVDDTAEVISGGPSPAVAASNRDNYTHSFRRRDNGWDGWSYVAWAWQQG